MRRFLISSKIHLKRILRYSGFLGHTTYKPFVIVCHPRTGSTLLHTYLNDHWQIHSYGELLSMEMDSLLNGKSAGGFYARKMKRKFPGMIKAVGFKFFYQYGELKNGIEILDLIRHDTTVSIIHLTRRNKLRTVLSYQLAKETDSWTKGRNDSALIKVETDRLIHDLERLESWEMAFDDYFSGHQVLKVSYEDLVSDPQKILKDVQEFLGVQPRKLRTVLARQHEGPLQGYILNPEEVRAALSGTPWCDMLEE